MWTIFKPSEDGNAVILLGILCAVTRQNPLVITCYLIKSSTEPELNSESKISNESKNTDLGCYWSSQFTYKAALTVEVNVFESVKLDVIHNISRAVSCVWLFRQKNAQTRVLNTTECSHNIFLDLIRVTEKFAGNYELSIRNENASYSVHFEVKVKSKPRKPYFIESEKLVSCVSESYPKPAVDWLLCLSPYDRCKNKKGITAYSETDIYGVLRAEHKLESIELLEEYIWCCASNDIGRECTQLYTIDLGSNSYVREILLKAGEPVVIRCRATYKSYDFEVKWSFESNYQMHCFEEREYISPSPSMVRVLFATSPWMEIGNSGVYTCSSSSHPKQSTLVTVLDKGFINMNTSREEHDIDITEEFCFVAVFNSYPAVRCTWYFYSRAFPCDLLNTTDGYSSKSKFCKHEYIPGEYTFYVENDDVRLNKTFTLNILRKPEVHKTSMTGLITCVSRGYPLSFWTWKKSADISDNCTEEVAEGITYGLPERKSHMWISRSTLNISSMTGTFSICCCATNSAGTSCEDVNFNQREVTSFHQDENKYIFPMATAFGGLSILLLITLIYSKCRKHYRYESQLQMIQYIGPSDNEYIYINFSVLEYDLKWEFPRENLEFGNILGSGAFGKVVTATAYGISKPGILLQVAVKMLKENPDTSEKDALMSELKMMTQIGHHQNIVNLLGACTVSGPIYLIFEYCCHGDLLNYLRSRRETFHRTWTDVVKNNNFTFYHDFPQTQKSSITAVNPESNGSYTVETRTLDSDKCEQTWEFSLSPGSNDISQHDEQLRYENTRQYEEEDMNVLTFEDLLSFSYQVAKGMEFLESKLCIHRDLAARNILVTHGKVAKICDFGLARDVVNDSNYVVKGNARLPVKWMAPESIFEGIYTIKSDVWSYGILLWEIFSLGVNPYPGMQVNALFYKLLQSGFKMDQPFYATDEIYFLMQSCWAFDSRKRPSFPQLVSFLGYQISNTEALVYQNLDNNSRENSSQTHSLSVNSGSLSVEDRLM